MEMKSYGIYFMKHIGNQTNQSSPQEENDNPCGRGTRVESPDGQCNDETHDDNHFPYKFKSGKFSFQGMSLLLHFEKYILNNYQKKP